jgi:hypothetical protein
MFFAVLTTNMFPYSLRIPPSIPSVFFDFQKAQTTIRAVERTDAEPLSSRELSDLFDLR